MSSNGHGPPRLKALDLQGYKTFASKSMFAFAPTITAIVGPNGSGKSNIADAIRWVLGEQSYSLLRGKRTDDMIFSGSEQRARASMAAATITFDNSDGWLPIEFSEVTVGRRAYRDGENEYLINGQRVRLRDVAELLARCGLGERTYTIIGQGLVDAALSLKAEERRRLFEEAAGIGLYRSRREETLRRLDQTQRNLDRVQDILAELRPRLRSLERQARRAQDFEQVRTDLNAALRTWYGYHWFRLGDVVARARQEAEQESATRDALRAREENADRELASARARIDSLRAGLHRNAQHVSAAYRERETLGRKLAVAEERLRWLGDQAGSLQAELDEIEAGKALLDGRVAAAHAEVEERQVALEQAQQQHEALTAPGGLGQDGLAPGTTLESLAGDRAAAAARVEALEQQLSNRQAELERLAAEATVAEQSRAESQRELGDLRKRIDAAEGERAHTAQASETARARQTELQNRLADAARQAGEQRSRYAALETRRALLQDLAQDAARVESQLAEAASRGRFHLEGRLSSSFQIPEEYRTAIAAALGPFAEAFGVPTASDLSGVLQAMGEDEDGWHAAILRLDVEASAPAIETVDDPDFIGVASQLVRAAPPYRRAIEALLGRTLVVRNRAAALRLLDRLRTDGLRAVTLAGDLFLAGGHVLVGEGRRATAARKGRLDVLEADLTKARDAAEASERQVTPLEAEVATTRREAASLAEALEGRSAAFQLAQARHAEATAASQAAAQHVQFLRGRLDLLKVELGELSDRIAAERQRKDEVDSAYARLELETQRADLSAGRESGAVHLAQAEAHLQLARSSLEEARARASELGSAWAERESVGRARVARREVLVAERTQLQTEIDAAAAAMRAVESRLEGLAAEAAPAETSLAETEQARAALEQEETRLRSDVQAAERRHAQAQIELARREEEMSSLQRRVEDDFGLIAFDFDETPGGQTPLPFEGLVEHLARVDELPPELEGQVNRLRLQLRRMGAINPEAQREYLEVKERVEFLTTQLADLRKAEAQLQGVIGELDELMEREFQRTFEAVANEFRKAFTRLFGGGSVRLTLTDPKDLTLTGIDIEARLPGRREQGLSMLSGGERSLTACALVFALLKVAPTPFCVLDEVDAMLDESNVARFREMLHELSADTQFIVITHNRQTVQAADVIYGVSMGPDSASRVISLRLDEAETGMAA